MAAVTYQALPEALRAQLPSPEALSHAITVEGTEDDQEDADPAP